MGVPEHLVLEPAFSFSQGCAHTKCGFTFLILLPEGNKKTEEANQPALGWIQGGFIFSECQRQMDENRQGQFSHSQPQVKKIKRKVQKALIRWQKA